MQKKLVEFSTFDEMSVHMGNPRYPNNVHFEVRARSRLDAARMRAAVSTALLRHPKACAQMAEHGAMDRSLHWEIHPRPSDPFLVVEAGDDASLIRCRNQLLSLEPALFQAPPLLVWLVRHPDGDSLIFNLHHAAADGIGSLRFLRSVTRAYAGEEDEISGPDPLRVLEQGLDLELPEETTAEKLKEIAQLGQAAMGKVTQVREESPEDEAGYYCTVLTLDAGEFGALDPKHYANATVNDLLVAAMHKTIGSWNRRRNERAEKIRIPVPVNLRPASWSHEVVGNFFMTFMTNTEESERSSPARLMESIADQTRRAKQHRFADKIYVGMKRRVAAPVISRELVMRYWGSHQAISALVTNLGRIAAPVSFGDGGDATGVWGSPPVPMPVGVGLGVASYGGELNLAFRHCRELMSQQAGEDFAELYLETLRWLC